MKYCVECGKQLELKYLENEGDIPYCNECSQYRFKTFNTAVSMIVINEEDEILLIQQYQRKDYILVAGYVNYGDNLEKTIFKELKEELNLIPKSIRYNHSEYFQPSNTLMCNFIVYVEKKELNPNEEIDGYCWCSKEEAKVRIKENSLAKKFLMLYLERNEENNENNNDFI